MKFLQFSFFALLATVPILPAANIGSWDLATIRILVVGIYGCTAVLFLWKRTFPVPVHPVFWTATGFLAVAGLSLFWAEAPAFAVRKFIFLAGFFPVLWLAAVWAARARFFAAGIAFGGFMAALLAVFQAGLGFLFGGETVVAAIKNVAPFLWGNTTAEAVFQFPSFFVDVGGPILRAFFPFSDPHTLSLFLGIAFFCTAGLLGSMSRTARPFAIFAMILMVAAIILSFSRGGYAAVLVGFFVFAVLRWRNFSGHMRAMVFSVALLLFVLFLFIAPFRDRFAASFDVNEGSFAARLLLWQDTTTIFFKHPLLGVGLGGLAATLGPQLAFRIPTNAHNTYLEMASELGIFGLMFWVGMLYAAFLAFVKQKTLLAHGFAASIAVFAAQSLVETTLYSPQVLFVFVVLAGFAAGTAQLSFYGNNRHHPA
ncbi:MAG: hypothetical protein A2806_01170 [Candidatus Terrybacteria bacterium RIFCSPHIGHO2_01_FULL_48_17]|uniref:O-antigen ligase-related domain-containing protein n=1 Tax=Candidatus Terrybacteria bacterium RIFCSPHIGHO2_01_FULL_48_17 TaxID=1802362 RepID=A0A1G2PLV3_9BACT|nr:MAG: hypothetical protein A2806_01170 [Candidatus Terrybacteria bacterium RIFCSPHIGHO2_01_FULL_48_17]